MLDTLLIGPLEILLERIYTLADQMIGNPGFAIIGMSLAMNLLLLPLYRQTDVLQREAIETEKKLQPLVRHIKKTFRGNEQFLMLQTLYRENHYKPTDSLRGLLPLMLEIPFFMAAYRFLSTLELLQGASFGPIADLGAPDGLLVLRGMSIHVLPILMTVINLASSLIYTKNAPLRTKLQLYGMALLFLVLLYDSPAGLVLYWTLNNLFSLLKNALMETKHPARTAAMGSFAAGLGCAGYVLVFRNTLGSTRSVEWTVLSGLLLLPMLLGTARRKKLLPVREEPESGSRDRTAFLLAAGILTVLLGVLIPAALIHTSPEEFIVPGSGVHPLEFVRDTALICAGTFLVWMQIVWQLAKTDGKKKIETVLWVLCTAGIADYMCFGRNYGILNSRLAFESDFHNGFGMICLNLGVLAALTAGILVLCRNKPQLLRATAGACVLAMSVMAAANLIGSSRIISQKTEQLEQPVSEAEPLFSLSRTGQNVVVLMLDRGISSFVPYLLEEKPVLQAQFEGFTYYPNTLSFGSHTNVGLPAVFGGYEYTPVEMDRRNRESLESKHNEALKVMPYLFERSGFETTVCDPTYAGYDWIPDLHVFDDNPNVRTHITMGRYNGRYSEEFSCHPEEMKRKFLAYSFFKAAPVFLHEYLYDGGRYRTLGQPARPVTDSLVRSEGISDEFLRSYGVLRNLRGLTAISDTPKSTFLMMCNETTHSPQLLQLPDYEPLLRVDNSGLESRHPQRTDGSGNRITMTTARQVQHYHCNMASFLQIGSWLDYLRENGVYDNTRIILVSDHGYFLHLREELDFGPGWDEDIMYYNPLLMVKDFGSTGALRTDGTLMTNADVPTLATQALIEHPVNLFTGNPLDSHQKQTDAFYLLASHHWDVAKNNGTTYQKSPWIEVRGSILNRDHWHYIEENQIPGLSS